MAGHSRQGPIGVFLRHPAAWLAAFGFITVSATWLHYSIAMTRIQELSPTPANFIQSIIADVLLQTEATIGLCAGVVLLFASIAVAVIIRRRQGQAHFRLPNPVAVQGTID